MGKKERTGGEEREGKGTGKEERGEEGRGGGGEGQYSSPTSSILLLTLFLLRILWAQHLQRGEGQLNVTPAGL